MLFKTACKRSAAPLISNPRAKTLLERNDPAISTVFVRHSVCSLMQSFLQSWKAAHLVCRLAAQVPKTFPYGGYVAYHFSFSGDRL